MQTHYKICSLFSRKQLLPTYVQSIKIMYRDVQSTLNLSLLTAIVSAQCKNCITMQPIILILQPEICPFFWPKPTIIVSYLWLNEVLVKVFETVHSSYCVKMSTVLEIRHKKILQRISRFLPNNLNSENLLRSVSTAVFPWLVLDGFFHICVLLLTQLLFSDVALAVSSFETTQGLEFLRTAVRLIENLELWTFHVFCL